MIWNEKRENAYCEITPALLALKEQWEKKNYIDPRLYKEYNVKRGLRDEDGRGVLTGLTRVGEIQSYQVTSGPDGEHIIPDEGMLYYRGIDCREIVKGSLPLRRWPICCSLASCPLPISSRTSVCSWHPIVRCPPTSSGTSS